MEAPLNLHLSTLLRVGVIAVMSLAPAAAHAVEVVPGGYTFDQTTACGLFCYHDGDSPDSIAGELIDGAYGVAGWAVDLGAGNSAEWVGWVNAPVINIDFDFGGAVHVETIRVGTTQNSVTDVVLPSIDVYRWDGSDWVFVQGLDVPEDSANDRHHLSTLPHGFLTLSHLGIDASAIRVVARFSDDGPWTFIDEIDFFNGVNDPSATPVPEPSTLLLLGGGLGGLRLLGRRPAAKKFLEER